MVEDSPTLEGVLLLELFISVLEDDNLTSLVRTILLCSEFWRKFGLKMEFDASELAWENILPRSGLRFSVGMGNPLAPIVDGA